MPLSLTARRTSLPQYFSQLGDLARPAGFEPATRCLEGRYAQRVSLPVRRSAGVPGCPGSDRKFPVLTGRIGHAGARRPLRPEPSGAGGRLFSQPEVLLFEHCRSMRGTR